MRRKYTHADNDDVASTLIRRYFDVMFLLDFLVHTVEPTEVMTEVHRDGKCLKVKVDFD